MTLSSVRRKGLSNQDQPWNDSPADSDAPPSVEEPDPAEVVEDEDGGEARDLAARRLQDPYVRETLDQRLREEEPDRPAGRQPDPEAGEMVAPAGGGGDVQLQERDDDPVEEPAAEEPAIHIRDESQLDH